MNEEHTKRIAEAADAVKAAKDELGKLEHDTTMSAGELAQKRLQARELVSIAEERHVQARIARAAAQSREWTEKALELRRQAEELGRKAEHARLSALGQVDGIFGVGAAEALTHCGRRPLRVVEMEVEIANLHTQAGALELDAKSVEEHP